MQSNKVSFRVAYLYPSSDSQTVVLLYKITSSGIITFMDKFGTVFTRDLVKGEEAAILLLSKPETMVWHGERKSRVYNEYSYYPELEEGKLNIVEKAMNLFYRNLHSFIKIHSQVKVKDENGNNINPNQGPNVLFELIEDSKDIMQNVQKVDDMADYFIIAQKLFRENPTAFVDLCYAFNMKNIPQTSIEKLYTEVMKKISVNPASFKEVFEHKQKELLILVKKALITNTDTSTGEMLIYMVGDFYYMDGEIIGENEPEVLNYFESKPQKLTYLMMKLDVKKEINPEPAKLAKIVDADPLKATSLTAAANNNRLTEMRNKVNYAFLQQQKAITKDPSKKKDAEDTLNEKLAEIRNMFSGDLADAMEAYISTKK